MMMEKKIESTSTLWRDIKGYEGRYQVSNNGEVKSTQYWNGTHEKILKPGKARGYLKVDLYKDGKKKMYKVHRLVAEAFLDNPDNLPEVNHIDEDKTNNRVENLEWCDHKYNLIYNDGQKRRAEKQSKPVVGIIPSTGEVVAEFLSTAEAERNGFSQGDISACCRGKLKTYKGLIWCFKGTSNEEIDRRIAEYLLNEETRTERMSKARINGKQSKAVIALDKQGRIVAEFDSTMEAQRNGFDSGHISECCKGKRKSHKGLTWKYKEVS